jgi:hypothetical protein
MRSDHQRRLSVLETRVGQSAHEAAIQAQREWAARTAPLRIARLVAEVNGEDPNLIEIPPYEGQWVHVHDPEATRALAAIKSVIEEGLRSYEAKSTSRLRGEDEAALALEDHDPVQRLESRETAQERPALPVRSAEPEQSVPEVKAPEPPRNSNGRRRRSHPFAELS